MYIDDKDFEAWMKLILEKLRDLETKMNDKGKKCVILLIVQRY
jgi:hypothetical protein